MKALLRLHSSFRSPRSREANERLRGGSLQAGQALVEAALIFVIIALIFGGLLEFGWAYYHYLALQDAVAEGAAFGIVHPTWWADSGPPANRVNPNPDNITYRLQHQSESAPIDWSRADITIEAPFTTPGNRITVTVRYSHTLLMPFAGVVPGASPITLKASAVQTILWTDG